MRKLETGILKTKRGFTLIELLVVLVIIGITITFAVLATGDFGHKRQFRIQSEQILENFHYAKFYSILAPQLLSLRLNGNTFIWQAWDGSGKWQDIKQDKLLRKHSLSANLQIIEHDLDKKDPRILVTPSGEIQPFKIALQDIGTKQVIYISIDENNEAHIEQGE